jgi:hypothetical protein
MKNYKVQLCVTGSINLIVKAKSEDDAAKKAMDTWDNKDIEVDEIFTNEVELED